VRVWRLARAVYPALDGEGARRYGGRWNAPGTPVIYAATHLSLAALELLVHVDPEDLPADLTAFEIQVPDDASIERLDPATLPDGWHRALDCPACREAGERWGAERRTLGLLVPSAVIPAETNVLLNPAYPDAARLHVVAATPFAFDPRLLSRSAR
jgi:RES domain-containing protein